MRKQLLPFCLALMVGSVSADQASIDYQKLISDAKIVMENPEDFIPESLRKSLTDAQIPQEALDNAQDIQLDTRVALNEKLKDFEFMGAKVDPALVGQDGPLSKRENKHTLLKPGLRSHIAFISMSIPDDQLKQIFAAMEHVDRASAVLVGFLDSARTIGESIIDLQQRIAQFEMENPPSIFIEFDLFDGAGIENVPVLAIYEGMDLVASVSGMPNFLWLAEQYDDKGEGGDLGVYGPMYPIQEQHFMEMIAERLKTVDFEGQQQAAIDNYWQKNGRIFRNLPVALKTESFLIDMSVTVSADIKDSRGSVIAKAGDTFNPLERLPFNRLGIIFDASKGAQLEWAIEQEQIAFNRGLTPVLLITNLNTANDAWDNFKDLQARFVTPIAQLDLAIKQRFQISAVPSLFEAAGGDMKITEVALDSIN